MHMPTPARPQTSHRPDEHADCRLIVLVKIQQVCHDLGEVLFFKYFAFVCSARIRRFGLITGIRLRRLCIGEFFLFVVFQRSHSL